MSYIYLASPYSGTKEEEQTRYEKVFNCTGHLFRQGYPIYSPIVHCHEISKEFLFPTDAVFWQNYNKAMLSSATELYVLSIEGVKESKGVKYEIAVARDLEIPIRLVNIKGEFIENL